MITKDQAMSVGKFYHVRLKNSDGTPVRCRANGKCKTWKTRPEEFRLPVKYGLYECFYLDNRSASDWTTEEPK